MNTLLVVFGILAACAASVIPPAGQPGHARQYPRFMDMFDDMGNPHRVDLEAQLDEATLRNVSRSAEFNGYWLYTRSNPDVAQHLYLGQPASVINSNFRFDKPVKVIVHGWGNSGHTDPNPALKAAFLDKDDYNIISLDWSVMAATGYVTAVAAVPLVGQGLGQFLAFLNGMGVPYSNMHLAGFSLGGHVVGSAGREVGGRIARITSLDPAGPLWQSNENRIAATDAVYVEGIHTDGLAQGIGTAIGHVDFFPNGGNLQTGCTTIKCNHDRSFEFFAATIAYNHMWGNLCSSMAQVLTDRCAGELFPMGNDDLRKSGSGIYRINTGSEYPF